MTEGHDEGVYRHRRQPGRSSERVGTLWVGPQPGVRWEGIADLSAYQAVPDGQAACLEELGWQDFGEGYWAMFVDRAMRCLADSNTPQAVDHVHLGWGVIADRVDEIDMFEIARTVVKSRELDAVVADRFFDDIADEVFTSAANPEHILWDHGLEFACITNNRQFFLVAGRFGEHAQVEHGPHIV